MLLAKDLIDEFNLMIFPVVLGAGKRLFGEGTLPGAFSLVESRVSEHGRHHGDLSSGRCGHDRLPSRLRRGARTEIARCEKNLGAA